MDLKKLLILVLISTFCTNTYPLSTGSLFSPEPQGRPSNKRSYYPMIFLGALCLAPAIAQAFCPESYTGYKQPFPRSSLLQSTPPNFNNQLGILNHPDQSSIGYFLQAASTIPAIAYFNAGITSLNNQLYTQALDYFNRVAHPETQCHIIEGLTLSKRLASAYKLDSGSRIDQTIANEMESITNAQDLDMFLNSYFAPHFATGFRGINNTYLFIDRSISNMVINGVPLFDALVQNNSAYLVENHPVETTPYLLPRMRYDLNVTDNSTQGVDAFCMGNYTAAMGLFRATTFNHALSHFAATQSHYEAGFLTDIQYHMLLEIGKLIMGSVESQLAKRYISRMDSILTGIRPTPESSSRAGEFWTDKMIALASAGGTILVAGATALGAWAYKKIVGPEVFISEIEVRPDIKNIERENEDPEVKEVPPPLPLEAQPGEPDDEIEGQETLDVFDLELSEVSNTQDDEKLLELVKELVKTASFEQLNGPLRAQINEIAKHLGVETKSALLQAIAEQYKLEDQA